MLKLMNSCEEKIFSSKIFRNQKDALYFASTDNSLMIFTNELNESGKREYLVTDPISMWEMHIRKPESKRHSHELIREGTPCKLYFDLEFNQKCNPYADGVKMVKIFIQFICWSLKKVHDITSDISNVLWLSSSSKEKFSAHLIFQLDDIAYENNVQLGSFVNYICNEIENPVENYENEIIKKPSKKDLSLLFIKDDKGNQKLFCDKGVYYKNKNFRLFLSTKFGGDRPFLLSKENKYCPLNKGKKDIFLDSLITYFKNANIKLLKFNEEINSFKKSKIKPVENMNIYKEIVHHYNSSNYPAIDEFVKNLISGTEHGYINHINYFKNNILEYSTSNYRYCKNIGRKHKSNNIMIIVSLNKKVYYQKCYDPDCRDQNFKSEEIPLPSYLFDDNYHYQRILDKSLTEEEEKTVLDDLKIFEEIKIF